MESRKEKSSEKGRIETNCIENSEGDRKRGAEYAPHADLGHQKVTRLNKLIDPDYCGKMTVRDLASIVLADTTNFPQGLDTPLCIGDFEGNFCTNVLSVTTGGEESDHICVMGDPNGDME